MAFCRECGTELENDTICDSCKEILEKKNRIIEADECPECGEKLNGQRVCSNCKYNVDYGQIVPEGKFENTIKFGLLDPNQRINTTSRQYCPVCGSKINPIMEYCSNCNFPIKK